MSATRPWVDAFADEMEAKLADNREKGDRGGWVNLGAPQLLRMLKREVKELDIALAACPERAMTAAEIARGAYDESAVHRECADVANFAMMIADVAGGLKPKPERQRQKGGTVPDVKRVSDEQVEDIVRVVVESPDVPVTFWARERLLALDLRDARAEVERLRAERRTLVERGAFEALKLCDWMQHADDQSYEAGQIADRILAEGGTT